MLQTLGEPGPSNSDSEDTPLVAPFSASPDRADMTYRYYVIRDKIEMGQMASIFFNKFGTTLFYLCLAIYLYGDLSIYGAAVAKTLSDVACTYQPVNFTCNDTIPDTEFCWEGSALNRQDTYRMFLVRINVTLLICIQVISIFLHVIMTNAVFRAYLFSYWELLYSSTSKKLSIFNY